LTRLALPVIVGRRAPVQIETAGLCGGESSAATGAVAEDLEKAFALITAQPECGTPVKSARVAGVRRVHLPRVGYYLYYRVVRRVRRIEILAFWHAKRGAGPPIG
jgi:plasmid stabilization system protein ParE